MPQVVRAVLYKTKNTMVGVVKTRIMEIVYTRSTDLYGKRISSTIIIQMTLYDRQSLAQAVSDVRTGRFRSAWQSTLNHSAHELTLRHRFAGRTSIKDRESDLKVTAIRENVHSQNSWAPRAAGLSFVS